MVAPSRGCSWPLLLIAMVVLGSNSLQYYCSSACPQYCFVDAAYMICTSSGSERLQPVCNCCLAQSGCKIYLSDGTLACSKP